MKIKKEYYLEPNNDNFIIKPINKTVHLNEVGLFLWDILYKNNYSTAELLNQVLNQFDISTVLALGEIDSFIKFLKENGIIE